VTRLEDRTADEVAGLLGLRPLPLEGGRWAQTHLDANGSAIHYLLAAGERSHLHLLPGPEVYFFHAGAPLDLLVLQPGGRGQRILLGPDPDAGHRTQHVVPGGSWQGSTSTGAWTLVGTAMAPAFRPEDYHHGDRARLVAGWPGHAARIVELTDGP
jgi:predicted cupin superfamily sugar epimerase